MTEKNLSEELFKPRFKHPETSSLVRRLHHHQPLTIYSALEGESHTGWYRMINRLLWAWRGVSPLEMGEVLARIASSQAEHTDDQLLDTVVGYRGGNWVYEWSKQASLWQERAAGEQDDQAAGHSLLQAVNLFSIAGYPYLKGDELAEQAQLMASRAYEQAAARLPGELKELEFAIAGASPVSGFLHMPARSRAPYPTVLLCGSLDGLQTDHYRLFHRYLAPRGIALLTVDMPSIGFSAKWKLTQDTSFLHQQVLQQLSGVPWVDHTRVAAFGLRFGANVAVRLAYLESNRLRAVACLGPVVHSLLSDRQWQDKVPEMYMDVLASRLGMASAADCALRMELNCYSLKTQGLLGRRCPTPMLSAYWRDDPFSPEEESRLIARSSAQSQLMMIERSPALSSFDRALHDIVVWLAKRLGC
ncbi:esterase FrsA [Erwinia psidii]|uniref:Esterase FrsA n=1 Tax=Erwinia psidii TaxID=69224 RepID=A0A3N6RWG0_9GAMM|nr:esterase FrsA [Erwinia psidii]MCX8959263.1 esterase FrsA [Erwinia psidii]MCX8962893.1 esterase FrsA [Erwinia psidii]RQM36687.1 esterase FrsA [Erwinia psidii]